MAEDPNAIPEYIVDSGDILESYGDSTLRYLRKLDRKMDDMTGSISSIESALVTFTKDYKKYNKNGFVSGSSDNADRYASRSSSSGGGFLKSRLGAFTSSTRIQNDGVIGKALDGFEEGIFEALGIPSLDSTADAVEKASKKFLESLSENVGVPVENLPKEISRVIGKDFVSRMENNPAVKDSIKKFKDSATSLTENFYKSIEDAYKGVGEDSDVFSDSGIGGDLKDNLRDAWDSFSKDVKNPSSGGKGGTASGVGESVKEALSDEELLKVGKSLKGLGTNVAKSFGKAGLEAAKGLVELTPEAIMVEAAFKAVEVAAAVVVKRFGVMQKKYEEYGKAVDKAIDRFENSKWKNLEASQERYQKDVRAMIEAPFSVLKKAANEVYDAWNSAIGVINQTQGYNKSDLQDLMSSYSARLKAEGLDSVVGSTDIITMLQSILESGLSGAVAEEFAYLITVLKKAVPTMDFTSYAESYASMVATRTQQGYSEAAAIKEATSAMKDYVSTIVEANRNVGGLSTNLNNASGMFNEIIRISQTSGSSNLSGLSSSLAIVQAVAGSVSSQVGNDLVSRIVDAALGGNDSSIVALRSLANTGAANTAFLKALTDNPGQVLSKMFATVGNMINKNTENYMEVAYSLADTFGISADALVRIDWELLSKRLAANTSASTALDQNMALLASGESTTSAESQKIQQLNQMLIDEGLAYLIDNETAQLMQEHLWEQEIANQQMEAEYAVDLHGTSLQFLESIASFVGGIWKITHPISSTLDAIKNLQITKAQDKALQDDLKKLLQAGKVGNGNATSYRDLTTYDVNALSRQPNILEMYGTTSSYYGLKSVLDYTNSYSNGISGFLGNLRSIKTYNNEGAGGIGSPTSQYSWGNGKSALRALNSGTSYTSSTASSSSTVLTSEDANNTINEATLNRAQSWLDTMSDYVEESKSFNEWYQSAQTYGFSNMDSLLESIGYTKSDMENQYIQMLSNKAAVAEEERKKREDEFWVNGNEFWTNTFPADFESWMTKFEEKMVEWQETYVSTMESFMSHLDEMYLEWTTYYQEQINITHEKQQHLNDNFDSFFVADFLKAWKDYYIGEHTNYYENLGISSSKLSYAISRERGQTGESVLALAKSLTESQSSLTDPQLQTNALLAQAVVILEAMFQNMNSSSGGLTLPTALSALGLNLAGTNTSSK